MKKIYYLIVGCMLLLPTLIYGQGNALDFDGTDDYVQVNTAITGSAYTIEAWVKPSDVTQVAVITLTDSEDVATGGVSHQIIINANSKFEHYTNDGGFKYVTGTTTVSADTWYHVAITASNSGNARLYVNGVEEGTATSISTLWTGGSYFVLGREARSAASAGSTNQGFFNGQIEELRIWDDVRTETEIQNNMNQSLQGGEAGLVAYYGFNDESVSFVEDVTGSGNNGTLMNMDSSTDWVTSGVSLQSEANNAISFDLTSGSTQKYFGTDSVFSGTVGNVGVTVELWIKPYSNLGDAKFDRIVGTNYGSNWLFCGRGGYTNALNLAIGGSTSNLTTPTNTITVNQWQHVAFTYNNADDSLKIYLDGDVVARTKTGSMNFLGGTKLGIGSDYGTASTEHFNGAMDEVRVWSVARTQQEIQDYMTSSLTGREANLEAYYNFDGTEGDRVIDLSLNGNHGSLFNINTSTDWIASVTTYNQTISNSVGFVMMAAPVETSYSDVLSEVWTQGGTGSDYPSGSSNVWTWDNSSTGTASTNWTAVSDLTTTITPGQGFLYYHFNDDNLTGSQNTSDTKISISGTENANPSITVNPNDEAWTLVANPFTTTIDWNNIASSNNIYANAQIWDPGSSSWVTTASSSLIAPFQSFFVQTFDPSSPSLDIGTGAKSTGGTFRGKHTLIPKLILSASSGDLYDEVVVQLNGDAKLGHDRYDASKLTPMNSKFVALSIDSGNQKYALQSVPMIEDVIEFPITVDRFSSGTVTLSLKESTLPAGYKAELVDLQENSIYTMDENLKVDVEIERAEKASSKDSEPKSLLYESSQDARFKLILIPRETTSLEDAQVATKTELHANYPNPFNPSTTMSYTLPQSAEITLEVFNVLGQRIDLVDQGLKSAGMHKVQWNAVGQASGVYFYRLTVNGQIMAPKAMTLIK